MHHFNCSCKFCHEWREQLRKLPNWQAVRVLTTLRTMPVPIWLHDEINRMAEVVSLAITANEPASPKR